MELTVIALIVWSVFFFQAEDGIRDLTVTGVQTCALPISSANGGEAAVVDGLDFYPVRSLTEAVAALNDPHPVPLSPDPGGRSEERRVGKECRSRWSPYH